MVQNMDAASSGIAVEKSTARDFLIVNNLVKNFGNITAVDGVTFSVKEGEILTLLGPSGCGKSTTLRCVAGLEELDRGEIVIGDEIVGSAEKNISFPPEKRHIGMVFQSYAVWPHMTVWNNVAYPLQVARLPRSEINDRVSAILELVGLSEMAQRNVTKLSGGQQQRTVLARAMVSNPRVLLLDEPLCNLDARLRESMRFEIRNLQQKIGITALYVTHDQAEAMIISDRVIVMNNGRIEQIDAPLEIYRRPANRFVAAFFGDVNFIEGKVQVFEGAHSAVPVEIHVNNRPNTVYTRPQPGVKPGDEVIICIRPHEIELAVDRSTTEDAGAIKGKISRIVQLGSHVEYCVDAGNLTLLCHSVNDLDVKLNSTVRIILKPQAGVCVSE